METKANSIVDIDLLAQMVQTKAYDLRLCDAPFRLLRLGTNVVLASGDDKVVARVPHTIDRTPDWLVEHLHIVESLARQGVPLLPPLCGAQILSDGQAVTFWPMGTARPPMTLVTLTDLLAQCHAHAPIALLEPWNPLSFHFGRWHELVPRMNARGVPRSIQDELGERLLGQVDALSTAWEAALSVGHPMVLIHGDPYPGNVVRSRNGELLLIDLDFIAIGPPEVDLAALLHYYRRTKPLPFAAERILSRCKLAVDTTLLNLINNANETITCAWLACLWGITPGADDELLRRMDDLDNPDLPWLDF